MTWLCSFLRKNMEREVLSSAIQGQDAQERVRAEPGRFRLNLRKHFCAERVVRHGIGF